MQKTIYDRINLIVPTFKRIKNGRFINHLQSTFENVSDLKNICYTFIVNKNDEESIEYLESQTFKKNAGDNIPLDYEIIFEDLEKPNISEFFNIAYRESKYKDSETTIISMLGDDMVWKTKGFDKIIIDEMNKTNGYKILYCDDDYVQHENLCVNFFTTRKLVEAYSQNGEFLATIFPVDYSDMLIMEFGLHFNLMKYLPNVILKHEHSSKIGADETFNRLRSNLGTTVNNLKFYGNYLYYMIEKFKKFLNDPNNTEELKETIGNYQDKQKIKTDNQKLQNFIDYEKNKINPKILFSIVSIILEKEWNNEKEKEKFLSHLPSAQFIEKVHIICIPDDKRHSEFEIITKEENYKLIKYYHYPNETKPFDFASARNFAKAWATGEWIFSLDFDELICDVWFEEIIKILRHPATKNYLGIRVWNCFSHYNFLTKHYEGGNGAQTRIFLNIPEIIWTGRLHETVDKCIPGDKIIETQIQIVHFGYRFNSLSEAMEKYKRNIRALCSDIIDNPDNDSFISYLGYIVGNGGQYLEQNNLLNKLKELT